MGLLVGLSPEMADTLWQPEGCNGDVPPLSLAKKRLVT